MMKKVFILFILICIIFCQELNIHTASKKENKSYNENILASATKEKEENKEENIQRMNREIKKEETTYSEKLGTMGRIYLPDINLSTGLYYANIEDDENYNAQRIVDSEDSAAYFQFGNKKVIADHNYQGFHKIKDLTIGAKAYIKTKDSSTITYQLNSQFLGKNTGENLTDNNGNSIEDKSGDLVIYTCYTSDEDIIITLWNKID